MQPSLSTSARELKVIIIGAGTGGLCLAHGLRSAGIDVRVFERDRTPTDRLIPTLALFEREMLDYGFAAVRASLANMERLHSHSPIARFATKSMFHLFDVIPPLQKVMRS